VKIIFILPEIGISGGVKAVFEYANHLHDRGHDVSVVYPLIPMRSGTKLLNIKSLLSRAKKTVIGIIQKHDLDWFNLKANLIRIPTLTEKYVPSADIIVATWWATAFHVNKYNNIKYKKKFYLAQHYEIWGGPEEKVNKSYKLGLKIIVNSTWLKKILMDNLNVESEALILHAPDLEQFYPENRKKNTNILRILMPYRYEKWKGVEDGIRAFEIIKKKCHQKVKLVMFGPPYKNTLPQNAEFHTWPVKDKLRKLYNSCDIFMFPSHHEGFGMPPMEAMACKCAVVTTNVGAVPDYTIPGETALVTPPQVPELLAENIIRLVENDDLRKQLSEAGHNYIINNFSWRKATDQLEKLFTDALIKK